jgi:pSer/pThr/pTyr-binding forkhead associated (FHA) protein
MLKLVISDDEGKTTVVPLARDEITIGRKEGNTIRLTERNVSRRHARLHRRQSEFVIEDLASYNGIVLNGAKIAQRTALSVSDRAQIGDYLIEVKAEATEAPSSGVVGGASSDDKTVPSSSTAAAAAAALDQTHPGAPPSAAAFASSPTQPVAVAVPIEADDAPTARAEVARGAPAASGPVARLVVLSSNFAGQDFKLVGAQTVIGRTDDNDIVINHRSISRNHARVVREAETGRYTISDLQSSNGVRVNGEEYGKVELRRGDIVDLGHVRLRFVEAGEDFVFGRDAQIADVPAEGGSRTWLIAVLALVVIGGGFAAYKVLGGKGKSAPTTAAAGSSGSGSALMAGSAGSGSGSALVAIVPPDAGSGSAVGSASAGSAEAPVSATLAKKLEACRALAEKRDWTEEQNCANEAAEIDANSAEVRALLDQAKKEMGNELHADTVSRMSKTKDYAAMAEALAKIDADSVYKADAQATHDKAKSTYRTTQLAAAKGLASKGKCDELATLATSSGAVWSDVGAAVRGVSCKTTSEPDGGGPPPPPVCNYEALLTETKDAYSGGQYRVALTNAEKAISCNRSAGEPKKFALLASCKLKDKGKFDKYYPVAKNKVSFATLAADCLDFLPNE